MSTIEEIIQRGSDKIIGYTFDLGEINHPKYGKANKLCGEFGVALKPGQYNFPPQLKDPRILQKLAVELLPIVRDALPTLLDEDIVTRLIDFGLGVAVARSEIHSEKLLKFFMIMLAVGWAMDDFEDDGKTSDSFTYRTFIELCDGVNLISDLFNALPNIHSSIEGIKKAGMHAKALLEEEVGADVELRASFISEALQRTFQATLAMKEIKSLEKPFSRKIKFESFRYITGNEMAVEVAMIIGKFELGPQIRNDFLYKTTLNCWLEVVAYHNSIFGLKKDVRKQEENDSHILYLVTNENMPLQDAFDLVYTEVKEAFNDYMISSRKLLDVYVGNENVKKVIEFMDYCMFGELFCYKVFARYGVQECVNFKYSA